MSNEDAPVISNENEMACVRGSALIHEDVPPSWAKYFIYGIWVALFMGVSATGTAVYLRALE